ncbi:MAG TPA: globin [Acidimicrobiales bacterium]
MHLHRALTGPTLYERVGGTPFFAALVERFYAAVADDPLLRPLYPDDLGPPALRLTGFLVQYWGGPTTYSEERGHPRLRMRHAPFTIGGAERNAWWTHMAAAVRSSGAEPADQQELLEYFDGAADAMINAPGP